jgi:hypothetical protein
MTQGVLKLRLGGGSLQVLSMLSVVSREEVEGQTRRAAHAAPVFHGHVDTR